LESGVAVDTSLHAFNTSISRRTTVESDFIACEFLRKHRNKRFTLIKTFNLQLSTFNL